MLFGGLCLIVKGSPLSFTEAIDQHQNDGDQGENLVSQVQLSPVSDTTSCHYQPQVMNIVSQTTEEQTPHSSPPTQAVPIDDN